MEHGDDPGLPGWKVGAERVGDGFKGHAVEVLPLLELKDEPLGWEGFVSRSSNIVLKRSVKPIFLEELFDGFPLKPPPSERTLLEVWGLKRFRRTQLRRGRQGDRLERNCNTDYAESRGGSGEGEARRTALQLCPSSNRKPNRRDG